MNFLRVRNSGNTINGYVLDTIDNTEYDTRMIKIGGMSGNMTPDRDFYTPKRIIQNGVATIVFWKDGTKTIVKCADGTEPDAYNAFTAALAKKIFGSNSAVKNIIKRIEKQEDK